MSEHVNRNIVVEMRMPLILGLRGRWSLLIREVHGVSVGRETVYVGCAKSIDDIINSLIETLRARRPVPGTN